jgi:hypothetical protein
MTAQLLDGLFPAKEIRSDLVPQASLGGDRVDIYGLPSSKT